MSPQQMPRDGDMSVDLHAAEQEEPLMQRASTSVSLGRPAVPPKLMRGRWRPIALIALATLIAALFTMVLTNAEAKGASQQVIKHIAGKLGTAGFAQKESLRDVLERTTSAPGQTGSHPTLTFDHIYVLSLPYRTDRRERMSRMFEALGLQHTFVDALDKHHPVIQWVAEQVLESREKKRMAMSEYLKVDPASLGGMGTESVWLSLNRDPRKLTSPLLPEFPTISADSDETWIQVLDRHIKQDNIDALVPKDPSANVTEILWDHNEKIDQRQINEGVLSTTYGHLLAMQTVIDNDDESALILEDDIDIEWDIQRLWARIHASLPNRWDIALLGHCWGYELSKPAKNNPLLHASTRPLCLHAYALSRAGARRFREQLTNPWIAYASPVDNYIPFFLRHKVITSYSVEPPLVIQRKDSFSDIQGGLGSVWRGLLQDSTVDRLLLYDGEPLPDLPYTDAHPDPATVQRGRVVNKCIA